MKTKLLLLLTLTVFIFKTNAQCTDYVNIPDANFKTSLLNDHTIDLNNDGEISCTEASDYAGGINVNNKSIASLTGLEAFINITTLSCYNNTLTTLDVSDNTLLTFLNCASNTLTTLDVSNSTALTALVCDTNNISTLNISNNTALTSLNCSTNALSTLDISTNIALTNLDCGTNNLTSLDVYNNKDLISLDCSANNLTSLDISYNTTLTSLICESNSLVSLNVANGNNASMTGSSFYYNPDLTCIQVDDVTYADSNWSNIKDPTASYSEDCPCASIVIIPDANFKASLLNDHTIDLNNDGEISCTEASSFTGNIIVNSKGISDLTGIEAFTSITFLNCSFNSLISLNVSNNIALTRLFCNSNNLTSLNVYKNTALTDLDCGANNLISLDVSKNTVLTRLSCLGNSLTSLNIANGNNSNMNSSYFFQNPDLTCIQVDDVTYADTNWSNIKPSTASYSEDCPCVGNVMIPDANFKASLLNDHTIDLNNDGEISCAEAASTVVPISVSDKGISDLTGIEAFTSITRLICVRNNLTSLDVSKNTSLKTLYCSANNLTSLNLTNNTALMELGCGDNNLVSLDVTNNTALTELSCSDNNLVSLDVTKNTALTELAITDNGLTTLNTANNIALTKVLCGGNNLVSLDFTTNSALTTLFCSNNNLIYLNIANGNYLNVSTSSKFYNNPNLTCIMVDDTTYADANWSSLKDATASYCNPIIYIPDANFKTSLLNDHAIDLNGDNEISFSEANSYTGSINVSNKSIADLTGIEAFTRLTGLSCNFNSSLNTLDVSANTALTSLYCSYTGITSLDLSANTALTRFSCVGSASLTSLNIANGNNENLDTSDPSYLNFKANSNLTCIQVDDVAYANTNFSSFKLATTSFSEGCNIVTWTGNINTNWNAANNWSGGEVPTASSDVEIASGLSNYPLIVSEVTVNSIALENGATLRAHATVNTNATYQKTLTDAWHLIAVPFANESYNNLIANNTFATGTGNNIGISTYANSSNSWNYKNNSTLGTIEAGTGVSVKLSAAGDILLTGTINATDISVPITTGVTTDFNLLGNPFTSYINSDTFLTANTSLLSQQTLWVWNGVGYETITNANPIEIEPTQGFFIDALSNGNILFDSYNQRNANELYSKQQGYAHIELKVNETSTKVYFIDNTTTGFDNGYDGSLFGGVTHDFAVYTKLINSTSDEKLAIQALPTSNITNYIIPVGLIAKAGEELTFSANIFDLEEGISVYLEDRVNNTFTNISVAPYKVTLKNEVNDAGQFYIHTSAKSLDVNNAILQNVTIYKSSKNQITITGLQSDATVTMYSLLGKEVVRTNFTTTDITTFNIPTIAAGVYILKLASEKGVKTQKIILD
jgi:Leucine-rich repeat (LRR) protein